MESIRAHGGLHNNSHNRNMAAHLLKPMSAFIGSHGHIPGLEELVADVSVWFSSPLFQNLLSDVSSHALVLSG